MSEKVLTGIIKSIKDDEQKFCLLLQIKVHTEICKAGHGVKAILETSQRE